jgi:hypothetical protein
MFWVAFLLAVSLQVLMGFLFIQMGLFHDTHASPSSVSSVSDSLQEFAIDSTGNENNATRKNTLKGPFPSVQGIEPMLPFVPSNRTTDTVIAALDNNARRRHDRLPEWLQEYIAWHGQQVQKLNPENWKEHKYLVMQCLESDDRCGGTADRLKPIPMLLYLAFQYNRILLIRWQRPCKLQEFLMPPPGGLDWRVPDWMDKDEVLGSQPFGGDVKHLLFHLKKHNASEIVVKSRYQSNNGGAEYYNEHVKGPSFANVYHDVWRAVFEPAPALANRIQDYLNRLSLQPGNYAAAHLRAVYSVHSRSPHLIKQWAINAVQCASNLRPGGPIYFCSDSKYAVEVVQEYAKRYSRNIVSLIHKEEPLHLEKANSTNRHPSEYYDTFIDLYLLGMSRCVAYSVGGFGSWGLFLGYNATCGYKHMSDRNHVNKCNWVSA